MLELPGELYRLSVLVKIHQQQHYVVGLEADRTVNPSQAQELLEIAIKLCKDENNRKEWMLMPAAQPVFAPEQNQMPSEICETCHYPRLRPDLGAKETG